MGFLIGPKVSEHFFKARDTEMSQKEVYEFNMPTFGKGVVFDVDHITRAEQFRFFANSLKSDRLRQYVGMIPLSVFFPSAPIEAHRKRDKARKELAAIFD